MVEVRDVGESSEGALRAFLEDVVPRTDESLRRARAKEHQDREDRAAQARRMTERFRKPE